VPDRLRRVMLRRNRAEVMSDLPPKLRVDRTVTDLSAATVKLCDQVVEVMRERGLDVTDADLELEQIPFELVSRVRASLAAAKTPAALEIAEQYEAEGVPLVVFSEHRTPIDALAKREGWATITGDTPSEERGRIVERFQAGELVGLAGTTQAMGVGVTLTRAHHVLMVDLNWTPARNSQAEDRCCRIGQEADTVHVTRLVADHVLDARILELLTFKQRIIEGSVEAATSSESFIGDRSEAKLVAGVRMIEEAAASAERAKAEEAQARAREEQEALEALGDAHDGREVRVKGKWRSAANAVEEWALAGLEAVAAQDADRAREENGVGFSKVDGEFGHSLVRQHRMDGLLSAKQWPAAVRLARKYRRQIAEVVGQEPAATA
jgi:hypothetical protein